MLIKDQLSRENNDQLSVVSSPALCVGLKNESKDSTQTYQWLPMATNT